MFYVCHTPAGRDNETVVSEHETSYEAHAGLMVALMTEQVPVNGSAMFTMTWVDEFPLVVTESHGFYSIYKR